MEAMVHSIMITMYFSQATDLSDLQAHNGSQHVCATTSTCSGRCVMVHVYMQPMLQSGAWTPLRRLFQGPAPHRHSTLLPLCSKWSRIAQRCSGGTQVRPITLSLCHQMTGLAKAFYKNVVQSPRVRLTLSLNLWQASGWGSCDKADRQVQPTCGSSASNIGCGNPN